MKCLTCRRELDRDTQPVITYERRELRYAGSCAEPIETLVDAGVFCSSACLIAHLSTLDQVSLTAEPAPLCPAQ